MIKVAFTGIITLLLLLQVSPVLPFADRGIRPDFILIMTIFFSIQFPLISGSLCVFALGCLVEVFSGVNTGLYPIMYLAVFAAIRNLESYFDFNRPFNLFLLTVFSLALKFLILLFCFKFVYEFKRFDIQEPFFKESVYTLLVFPAVFPLLRIYKKPKEDLELKDVILIHEQRHR